MIKNKKNLEIVFIGLLLGLTTLFLSACSHLRSEMDFEKGLASFKAGNISEAQRLALTAEAENPDLKKKGLLAWTYLKQGYPSKAREIFQKIEKLEPDHIVVLQGFAWVEYAQGNYGKAEGWFKKQQEWAKGQQGHGDWTYYAEKDKTYINSILSDAWYGLGLIALIKGDFLKAQVSFQEALKQKNDFIGHGPIRASLGDAFYYQGKFREAAEQYKAILKENKDPLIYFKLGWSLELSGESLGAKEAFSKAQR
jgi:tetratricopeptide (TPR) repeat protein